MRTGTYRVSAYSADKQIGQTPGTHLALTRVDIKDADGEYLPKAMVDDLELLGGPATWALSPEVKYNVYIERVDEDLMGMAKELGRRRSEDLSGNRFRTLAEQHGGVDPGIYHEKASEEMGEDVQESRPQVTNLQETGVVYRDEQGNVYIKESIPPPDHARAIFSGLAHKSW